jgi:hypothetical protein
MGFFGTKFGGAFSFHFTSSILETVSVIAAPFASEA